MGGRLSKNKNTAFCVAIAVFLVADQPYLLGLAAIFSESTLSMVRRQRVQIFIFTPPSRLVWRFGSCSRLEAMLEWLREFARLERRPQASQILDIMMGVFLKPPQHNTGFLTWQALGGIVGAYGAAEEAGFCWQMGGGGRWVATGN